MLMGFIWMLLIGLAAGWLAGQIMKTPNSTIVGDILMGVIGSVVGGLLFGILGLGATNLIGRLLTATVGAVVLIAGLRAWGSRRRSI